MFSSLGLGLVFSGLGHRALGTTSQRAPLSASLTATSTRPIGRWLPLNPKPVQPWRKQGGRLGVCGRCAYETELSASRVLEGCLTESRRALGFGSSD